jgi:hypothetical protein
MTTDLRRALAKADAAQAVSWRQLCAVTTSVYAPTIDDAEWAARVKDKLVALGFLTPRADELTRALRAVERQVHRPLPSLEPERRERPATVPALSRSDAATLLADIRRRFLERTASA